MNLQISIVPASANAGKATIRSLLGNSAVHAVRGIYRDVSKAPSEFTEHPKFAASVGDVSSGEGLDITGSDAVLYIPPPPQDPSSLDEHATRTATHVKDALSPVSVRVFHSELYEHKLTSSPERIRTADKNHVIVAASGGWTEIAPASRASGARAACSQDGQARVMSFTCQGPIRRGLQRL